MWSEKCSTSTHCYCSSIKVSILTIYVKTVRDEYISIGRDLLHTIANAAWRRSVRCSGQAVCQAGGALRRDAARKQVGPRMRFATDRAVEGSFSPQWTAYVGLEPGSEPIHNRVIAAGPLGRPTDCDGLRLRLSCRRMLRRRDARSLGRRQPPCARNLILCG